MRIAAVGKAFPGHYYDQDTLIAAFKRHWGRRHFNLERLETLHRNVLVGGRHLALPLEDYEKLSSFTESNDAFIRTATELGARAINDGLDKAGLAVSDIDHIFFATTTGVATPSVDALLVNRLGLRQDVKRTPLFGLGCLAGVAGVARAADVLRGFPDQVALLVSVELCSLTLQREDLSIANIIASGLFGDGAAAAVLVGDRRAGGGPEVLASRSFFYPDTERVMGWDVTAEGFRVVLSADVPKVVKEHIADNVDEFLEGQGIDRSEIVRYVCHPGGPKVLKTLEETLELPPEALALTWECLRRVGNLSSASALLVLGETLDRAGPPPGAYGLMMAMGPGFCSEMVLLRW